MPTTLFHYTNIETIALILKNRTVRFTRLDKVDDPQEQRTADSRNLAKFRFVSCWTNSSEESIPMWREYAGVDSGIRIELPVDPFKRYELTANNLPRASSSSPLSISSDCGIRMLRIPFSTLLNEGPFVQEAVLDADILHEITYTDEPDLLFPEVMSINSEGTLSAKIGAVGIAKSRAWAYQHEWRYILTIYPFALKDGVDSQAETLKMLRDTILDRREPNLPEYYDMKISDKAFETMRITTSPAISAGNKVILDALISRYNPSASVSDSILEL